MKTWCRVIVFVVDDGLGTKRKRRASGTLLEPGYAYQALNETPRHERMRGSPAATRIRGTGSFYWPSMRAAWRRALVILRNPKVRAVKVETISGHAVGHASRMGDGQVCAYAAGPS